MQAPGPAIPQDRAALYDLNRMGIDTGTILIGARVAVGSCDLAGAKDRSAPGFRQSMSGEVYVECRPGNGNIDLIGTDWQGGSTQISKRNTWRVIHDLVKRCQVCMRDEQFV